ncbi:MAG: hypothetical protein KKA64_00630, partial [Nanoarchaeota archaeon]|nr:hypothetical protein [Nanoarchaeota archaeon]
MKAIIFDSSTLISLAMNGLLAELKELKKRFQGKFIITKQVKRETIDKPLTIKRFELEALKIKSLLDERVLEMPDLVGVGEDMIDEEMKKILDVANSTFIDKGKTINIISDGEAS